ncbi:hypothetical protein BOW52_10705, partial [Solemya elarraichensis gill symbiont]
MVLRQAIDEVNKMAGYAAKPWCRQHHKWEYREFLLRAIPPIRQYLGLRADYTLEQIEGGSRVATRIVTSDLPLVTDNLIQDIRKFCEAGKSNKDTRAYLKYWLIPLLERVVLETDLTHIMQQHT